MPKNGICSSSFGAAVMVYPSIHSYSLDGLYTAQDWFCSSVTSSEILDLIWLRNRTMEL